MAPGYKQQEECHGQLSFRTQRRSEATCQQVRVVLYQVTLGQLNLHWQRIPKSAESCTAALCGTRVNMFGWQLVNEISWNPRICDDTVTVLFISKSTQKVMANHASRCVSSANCRSDNGLSPAWSHPWATQLQHHRVVSDTTCRYTSSACEAFGWALITPDPSEWAPPLSMEGQNKQRWDLLSRMRRPEVVHEQFMRLDFAGTGERC